MGKTGYSAFTKYPLSRLPTPSDRCLNRNFLNYFLMSTRVNRTVFLLKNLQQDNTRGFAFLHGIVIPHRRLHFTDMGGPHQEHAQS